MPQITKEYLKYTDYSWEAVPGDDPDKRKKDADYFNRHEGYEVINILNSFNDDGRDISIEARQIIEWMLHEKLPSDIHGRRNTQEWVIDNFNKLSAEYEA